jgi:hypothetical protein
VPIYARPAPHTIARHEHSIFKMIEVNLWCMQVRGLFWEVFVANTVVVLVCEKTLICPNVDWSYQLISGLLKPCKETVLFVLRHDKQVPWLKFSRRADDSCPAVRRRDGTGAAGVTAWSSTISSAVATTEPSLSSLDSGVSSGTGKSSHHHATNVNYDAFVTNL